MRLSPAIMRKGLVLALLVTGFAAFTPSNVLLLLAIGSAVLASLAFRTRRYESSEAWTCLLAILGCGVIGVARFLIDLGDIHPFDRGEFFRLYAGAGLIVGILAVLPYLLLRLAYLGLTGGGKSARAAKASGIADPVALGP